MLEKKSSFKGSVRYFMTQSTKDKTLEADPNLEGGVKFIKA